MHVKLFLTQAAQCKTQEDLDALMETLQQHFCRASPLASLPQYHVQAYMFGESPFLRVELKHIISGYHVTEIRPDIREGKLIVEVETFYIPDGLGVTSEHASAIEGMKDTLEPEGNAYLDEVAQDAAEQAVANHVMLLERAGAAYGDARTIAMQAW
jgi:hypothetical protein